MSECDLSQDVLAYAGGAPPDLAARIRATPEDFQVDEILGFEPDGNGCHALLHIRKRGMNSETVARELMSLAGVGSREVGFSGLKDRHAVTTQWFSVDLSGRQEPDWGVLEREDLQVIGVARHRRKLRRGTHRSNRFLLVLSEVSDDLDGFAERVARLREMGVPNYFGEQRFGRDGGNLARARAMFSGERKVRDRHRRGLYLSAARSALFNRVLSRRVADGTWNQAVAGDVLNLDGRRSVFHQEQADPEIYRRLLAGEIHVTGPLWGRGALMTTDLARELESASLAHCQTWRQGLENAGLKQERRALRVNLPDLAWRPLDGRRLELGFTLPAGAYATMVVRELAGVSA